MAERKQEESCPTINTEIKDLLVTSCLGNDQRKLRIMTLHDMNLLSEDVILESPSSYMVRSYMIDLEEFIRNDEFTDVVVHIEDQIFHCHLTLLQCYSDYFMAFNGSKVIRLPEGSISAKSFRNAYEWMKTDNVKPEREGIVELYMTAKYLQMDELIAQLWFCFDDTIPFDEDQAFLLYLEASKFDVQMIKDLMITRISKFFICVVATEEFLEFTEKEVIGLVTSNYIAVNSEMEILMSILRWLSYKWDERKCDAEKLLKYIRFNLMPGWFLTTLEAMEDPPIIKEILQSPEIGNCIDNGISYAVSNQFMGAQLPLLDSISIDHPVPRQWIINEKCNYHHKYTCHKWEFITYDAFNKYLMHIIQTQGADWKKFKYHVEEPTLACGCDAID